MLQAATGSHLTTGIWYKNNANSEYTPYSNDHTHTYDF